MGCSAVCRGRRVCTRASRCAEKEEREAERSEGAGEGVRERGRLQKRAWMMLLRWLLLISLVCTAWMGTAQTGTSDGRRQEHRAQAAAARGRRGTENKRTRYRQMQMRVIKTAQRTRRSPARSVCGSRSRHARGEARGVLCSCYCSRDSGKRGGLVLVRTGWQGRRGRRRGQGEAKGQGRPGKRHTGPEIFQDLKTKGQRRGKERERERERRSRQTQARTLPVEREDDL